MERLHRSLRKNSSWYDAWHEHKHHQVFHWMIFVLLAILVAVSMMAAFQVNRPTSRASFASTKPIVNPSAPLFKMPYSDEAPGSPIGTTNATTIGITAFDREGGNLRYTFSWGDKSPIESVVQKAYPDLPSTVNFTHQYTAPGSYLLTASVSDGIYTTTKTGRVTVISPQSHPVVSIRQDPTSINASAFPGQGNVVLLGILLSATNGDAQVRTIGINVGAALDLEKFRNIRLVDENGPVAATVVQPTLRNPGYTFNLGIPYTIANATTKNLRFVADISPTASGSLETRFGEWLITDVAGLPIGPNVIVAPNIKKTLQIVP